MSSHLFRIGCATLAFALAACSHPHYKISLRDGREIVTDGEPRYVPKTGYYRYRALNGKDALVRADEAITVERQ